jgi:hypothetical protein
LIQDDTATTGEDITHTPVSNIPSNIDKSFIAPCTECLVRQNSRDDGRAGPRKTGKHGVDFVITDNAHQSFSLTLIAGWL